MRMGERKRRHSGDRVSIDRTEARRNEYGANDSGMAHPPAKKRGKGGATGSIASMVERMGHPPRRPRQR